MIKIEKNIIKKFINGVLRIYCKLLYKIEINGLENVPKEGAVILCANHVSLIDAVIINCFTPRKTRYLAKEELNKFYLRPFIKLYKIIMVKRDAKDLSAVKESLKALKSNDCLVIFPEGTRNGMEKGQKAKDGAAFFAVKTGAKVIPVGISGGEKPFKKMYIKYGQPLDFSGRSKDELDQVTDEIMKKIIELAK